MTWTQRRLVISAAILGLLGCGADKITDTSKVVRIVVLPQVVSLLPSAETLFVVIGLTSDGDTGVVSGPSWSASAGSILSSGRYTAPPAAGTYAVRATVNGLEDSAAVSVSVAPVVKVIVFPKVTSVSPSDTTTFVAHGINSVGDTLPISVLWSTTGGTIDPTGLWHAPATAGEYLIRATNGSLEDSALGTVTGGGATPSEPHYTPGSDSLAWHESFATYSSTTNLISSFSHKATDGSINLDKTTFFDDSQAYRVDFDSVGCLGAADADVLIEKSLPASDSRARNWYVSYEARWQSGYKFAWPRDGSCGRGNASKEMVNFRDTVTGNPGRITLSAIEQAACPDFYGSLNGLLWGFTIAAETTSVQPAACVGKGIYNQYLGIGTKDPESLADNQWHRITYHILKESAVDAGDGEIQMWIDGTLILNYDGTDPGNPAYHQVFTRTNGFGHPLQFPSILNAGAPQAQSRWYDAMSVWYHP